VLTVKLIRSVIHPDKLHEVTDALSKARVSWVTTSQVCDHNPQRPHTMTWRGRTFEIGTERTEIDVAVHDDDVDDVINIIIRTARTGGVDDGYVSVMPVEHRYDIRTGTQTGS
jgi:nitrogen regulatory protein P-II 1